MDMRQQLEFLQDQSRTLTKAIRDIEVQIDARLARIDNEPTKRDMSFLKDRYEIQLNQVYDLGKVAGQIEDLERLIKDRDDREQSNSLTENWPAAKPAENHLDWLSNVGSQVVQSAPVETPRSENVLEWIFKGDEERAPAADSLNWTEPDPSKR